MNKNRLFGGFLIIFLQLILFIIFKSIYEKVWQSPNLVLLVVVGTVTIDFFVTVSIIRNFIFDFLKRNR